MTSKHHSKTMLQRAHKNMPMGVADSYRYWGEENTVFLSSMKGCTITDCDDQTFVDFRLAYGPIILGYRDERIDNAVIDAITNVGAISGFSTGLDSDVVELIKSMCPNIEKMRFANSGTEAVIGAIRTARGYTKRNKIVVIEGGFHGLHDEVMWKSDVDNWNTETEDSPKTIPFGAGIPQSTRDHQVSIPLNDFTTLDRVFAEYGNDIAAILIEPIMGNCGSISSTQDYMQKLRDVCDTHNSLLILDEVKTGFRVAKGGVQELYGIHADLTTYAKALGNGYPVAAFGGKAKIMDTISFEKGGVTHGGTYTANMVALSAAKATLTVLKNTNALETISCIGKNIQNLLSRVFIKFNIEYCFAGPDSMFGVHLGSTVPTNYRDWKQTDSQLYTDFALNLIENGVMLEPDSREPWFICEAHQNVDLIWLEKIAEKSMAEALQSQKDKTEM